MRIAKLPFSYVLTYIMRSNVPILMYQGTPHLVSKEIWRAGDGAQEGMPVQGIIPRVHVSPPYQLDMENDWNMMIISLYNIDQRSHRCYVGRSQWRNEN